MSFPWAGAAQGASKRRAHQPGERFMGYMLRANPKESLKTFINNYVRTRLPPFSLRLLTAAHCILKADNTGYKEATLLRGGGARGRGAVWVHVREEAGAHEGWEGAGYC